MGFFSLRPGVLHPEGKQVAVSCPGVFDYEDCRSMTVPELEIKMGHRQHQGGGGREDVNAVPVDGRRPFKRCLLGCSMYAQTHSTYGDLYKIKLLRMSGMNRECLHVCLYTMCMPGTCGYQRCC